MLTMSNANVNTKTAKQFSSAVVRVTDLQIWGIGTKEVNRLQYDFLLARYLKCPKMADGPLHHFAKCHFGGHL